MARKITRSSPASAKRKMIWEFMKGYVEENRMPPSIRDIGEATNINSTSVIRFYIETLLQYGWLEDRIGRKGVPRRWWPIEGGDYGCFPP